MLLFSRKGSQLTNIKLHLDNVEDLKEMEYTSKEDFLTNGEYFVSRCVMTMKWPHVVTIHQDSFSVVNFNNKTIQLKGRSLKSLVSIHSNPSVVAILNSANEIHFYKWAGKEKV